MDCDPYGEPWPVLDAFFESEREFPPVLAVVVNDGLRQKLKTGGAWSTHSLAGVVGRYGNQVIYDRYLDICQEMIQEKAGQVGYTLARWAGYYCGYLEQTTHYAAVLTR